MSIAIIRLCDSVCLSVCLHGKTKTAETKIAKIGAVMVTVRYHKGPLSQMATTAM